MLSLSRLPPCVQAPVDLPAFRTAEWHNGEIFTEAYKTDSGYLLRFAGLADFEVSADGTEVRCSPALEADDSTVDHIFLNHVFPNCLSQQRRLVFHASAVKAGDGAIAFLGEAGRGKSTLAAKFASAGFPFLTDDGLCVERVAGGYQALPSHPSIRLWEDSQTELGLSLARAASPISFSPKCRVYAGAELPHQKDPLPLKAVYCLGAAGQEAAGISVRRLEAHECFQILFAQSFLLDIADPARVRAHFNNVAEFANLVRCYRLDYSRRYEALDEVAQALLAHSNEDGQ